jgi:hypothetical protein
MSSKKNDELQREFVQGVRANQPRLRENLKSVG